MSIPKTIHFCWLSGEQFPDEIKRCIDSWHSVMPDYNVKLWDKDEFCFQNWPYAQEALDYKKYAFASDIIRLYALYTEGGIYLDSDVTVLKKFDDLSDNKAYIGFESGFRVGPWLIASEKENPLIKEMLDYYIERHFCDVNGCLDTTPNTIPITRILSNYGLKPTNTIQRLEYITVYPEEYFCPKNPWTGKVHITPQTYAMHLFAGVWNDNSSAEMDFLVNIHDNILKFMKWRDNNNIECPVLIYGTGVVALRCLECLSQLEENHMVSGFVVTHRDNNWKEIAGITIKEVAECSQEEKAYNILVGTNPRSHEDIKNTLDECGFSNVYYLGQK